MRTVVKPTALPSWSRRDLVEVVLFALACWTIVVLTIVLVVGWL